MSVVVNYYQEKTRLLLQKYGPGPRVHYHLGIVEPTLRVATDRHLLQRQIVQSQEDMMVHAAAFWQTPDLSGKRLLDVGAGLGGASLWMAMNKHAQVDSLVQFAEHAGIIRSFAQLGGVSERVSPQLGDAHTYTSPQGHKYDVVMAMESPCYFDRYAWFKHLDTILADGGEIWLEDGFIGANAPAHAKASFDDYFKTDMAMEGEYLDAARAAGFVGEELDITAETAMFWKLSAEWVQRELELARSAPFANGDARCARLERSYDAAMMHFHAWNERHYGMSLFRFRRG